MCGICGRLNTDGRPVEEGLLKQMTAVLAHRGPDGEGIYINGAIGLGHRRLAIIDLSPAGRQPLPNEDKSIWVVLNGEIYNFAELRDDLEARGHVFASRTDTEVIVHLYEERGVECLPALRGMFAFALWDQARQRLLLARDRVGKKPLVYALQPGRLLFASEAKAIIQDPTFPREVDLEALHHYLTYQYVPSPWTMFRGIRKLPPAHYLLWEGGRVTVRPYWTLRYDAKRDLSEAAAADRFRELLEEATRLRLVSDVPLGAFLSGGIDSSAVVAAMCRLTGRAVKTFSIGFAERAYDELAYARIVARRFGTDHHEYVVRPDAVEVMPRLVWHYSEPFADSSAIPSYYLARLARQHVTVALNGDGGDESFGGYPRYGQLALVERAVAALKPIPAPVRAALAAAARIAPGRPVRRMAWLLRSVAETTAERYARWMVMFPDDLKDSLYTPEMRAALAGHPSIRLLAEGWGRGGGTGLLDKTLAADVAMYLPDALLVKMDIATMAHGLEVRSPLLDHRLMEFAAALPPEYKRRGTETKVLMRKALADVLPREILTRPKMGFGVPLGEWFRADLRGLAEELLLESRTTQRGYFDSRALRTLLDQHFAGRHNHGYRLWALLMLELWHRMFIDPAVPPTGPAGAGT